MVEAAAVLEEAVPTALLVRVCDAPRSRAAQGLDEAVASGLLIERGQTVCFRHVLAAQTVYEAISSQRRAEIHGRCASVLEQLDAVPLGQLAHHLKRAGRDAQWVRVAEAAAEAAAGLGHDAEAVRILEELLREAPLDAQERCRIALRLGRASSDSALPRLDLVDLLAAWQ
jgi:predicted ATPase